MYKQTLPLFLCIFLSACDLIDYHPYDGRLTISERDINDHNIPLIEAATKDKDTIRFVLMGDTQRSYDETEDFVKHINTKKRQYRFHHTWRRLYRVRHEERIRMGRRYPVEARYPVCRIDR